MKLLIEQIINGFRQERSRASATSLNGKLHEMGKGKMRDGVVCSNRQMKGERRQMSQFSDSCSEKPRMHLGDCFSRYHKMKKFKKGFL